MDVYDILLQAGLTTSVVVVYLIFFRKRQPEIKGTYNQPGWNYPLKWWLSRWFAIGRWKAQCVSVPTDELPRTDLNEGWDSVDIRATSADGATVLLGIRKLCGRRPTAEVTVYVKLADGSSYRLPKHPDTATCVLENTEGAWSASGLKIQVLESETRLRILYNGLLTSVDDGDIQHVTFNFIWRSATNPLRYPEDWSTDLAAQALALEQWRDTDWPYLLGKWEEGGWMQCGAVQGRFQSFDQQGVLQKDEYLRLRGIRERSWAPYGYKGRRRSVTFTASSKDGTMVHLRGLSYRNVLTQCISGHVRFPNYRVESIINTDFVLQDFSETVKGIPKVHTINVSTRSRKIRMVLRINSDGGKLLSGIPYQQELQYRTMVVSLDESAGSGILELGYEPTEISDPTARLSPPRTLKWLSASEVDSVGYCLPFEARAAACTDYVGGKGASLALLASVQNVEDYKVPPGFCLSIRALEKHLDANPKIVAAIREIEAANEDYEETNFKDKCTKAVELFINTEIVSDVRDDILAHLKNLRDATTKQNLEQRFAVRSSAVGEDSETLSAAGQNETILGCTSDEHVLRAVQKCWASMFAFTSAYYRRQNGQTCACGGGVVVQALVEPRAAGVMFTRHPDRGDASRLLITANYGLGETVVSGSVEPDTIIVKRGDNSHLSIMKVELGSKAQRVMKASTGGVTTEDVPETERGLPCLSEADALKLAQIGVAQENLWGAGRDIEWAITKDGIYLLQARPITSLERWTEEELLHELDTPIMSDDELTTFANTGEVLPKPVTPLTVDLVLYPLMITMNDMVSSNMEPWEDTVILTHNRVGIALYSTSYRKVSNEIDMNIRMLEMAIHGRKVADQNILNVAKRRHPPHWTDKIELMSTLLSCLLTSKWKMDENIKTSKEMNIKYDINEPLEMFEILLKQLDNMKRLSSNHSYTSAASTSSQFIAMSVLLEGAIDFTTEHCNEINTLLSSGDVLSAEVPLGLAKLARELESSGKLTEFKGQDPKKAMDWLMANLPHIHAKVLEFLEEHGHRAIMEFDMSTKPWALVPEELMNILQNIKVTEKENPKRASDDEIIAALTTPKKSSTRKVLSWVLPLCRRTVRHREGTKAHLILGIHKLRLAAIELGKQLVRRWYLPHHDLIFFFRAKELTDYITSRDPALLRKAIQRQQYYPKWCKLKYSEMNTGWVQPLPVKAPTVTAGDVKLEATSVCGGEVIARACVVKDISEVHQLQQGDVLITHATDIGWSPYFPLLTGIVTELGGLISHGAVIAREYGLPCIVGAMDATDIFKTGDTVRLSGTKGLIEKVQIADKSKEQQS
ncbi:putative phosphoenolpyruvate synthase [Achroia grisella]|uniref:putative phosphoenolpyruvate synthase n=1 Tax=Achroia grisella TaxID=688607 RepID=UPI0027D2A357|nr:putative phosphoenolpyruvate synthase [Achroia grisella]